ncbi:MAG: hypothetical protein LBK02_05300, partial [Treponema sp.]|nr:hypothetical protein [Treponema sp.]
AAVNSAADLYAQTIHIGNSGDFTLDVSKTIAASARLTVTGNTVNSGTIVAGPVTGLDPADSANASIDWTDTSSASPVPYAVVFEGNYTETDDGLFIGNDNDSDPANANLVLAAFKGSVSFGAKPYPPSPPIGQPIANSGWLVFPGNADQNFTTDGARELPNVLVYHTPAGSTETGVRLKGSTLPSNGSVPQRGVHLIIRKGFLDLGGGAWLMAAAGTPAANSGFTGSNSAAFLNLNTNTRLITGNAPGNNLDLRAGFTLDNGTEPGPAVLEVSGNITIENGVNIFPLGAAVLPPRANLTLDWTGASARSIKAETEIGNLLLSGSPGALTLNAPLALAGSVNINPGKTLDAGRDSGNTGFRITLMGDWIQTSWDLNSSAPPALSDLHGIFRPQNGAVEFGSPSSSGGKFRIAGNTTWYDLVCHEPNAALLFSNWPHEHKVTHKFEVYPADSGGGMIGSQSNMITLARLVDFPVPVDPVSPPAALTPSGTTPVFGPPAAVDGDFWSFELESGGELNFNYVSIYYSYSRRLLPLPPPSGLLNWRVDAYPYLYLTGSGASLTPHPDLGRPVMPIGEGSYYNVNWFAGNEFYYSFTEDSDGNGRIDRIRLQAAFEILDAYPPSDPAYGHKPFEGFEVEVSGYKVIDYARADMGTNAPDKMDSIYIFLEEQDYTDGNTRITWTIKSNMYLKDLTTRGILIGEAGHTGTTWDTVPPRINYALTVPGSDIPEIYVQMSEPVDLANINSGGLSVLAVDPGISGPKASAPSLNPLDASGAGAVQFLIPLDSAYDVKDLAGFGSAGWTFPHFALENVRDLAEEAPDLHTGTEPYAYRFPSPKYPRDYGYTAYEFVRNYVPGVSPGVPDSVPVVSVPNAMNGSVFGFSPGDYGKGKHRVSDALVSVPPRDGMDKRYFIWPVWAQYTVPSNTAPAGNDFWGQQINDTGIIWDFSGTKYLEERDTSLQVKVNTDLGGLIPTLYYSATVPGIYRARPVVNGYGHGNAGGNTGLWLPLPPITPPSPIVPNYINLVPHYYQGHQKTPGPSGGSGLYTFKFITTDPGYDSGNRLEFFLHLETSSTMLEDIFAARLAILPGEAIPANWYQLVRPFAYNIRDVTLQRGGVTILNNVINPNNGERTYIRYHLVRSGRVTIQVFTLDGTLVKILRRENRGAGEWVDSWDGTNNGGRAVARGMYFVRVVGPDIDEIRKVMVVK